MKEQSVFQQLSRLACMAVRCGEIEMAAKAAGFSSVETRTEQLCSGTQDIVILRK